MKYRQSQYLSKDANTCVAEILRSRGVENIEAYMRPSQEYENDSMLLDNVQESAGRLIWHLNKNSSILFVVDPDNDGFASSAILWLYIKDFFPDANLKYICHEHKAHGLEDIIDEIEQYGFDLICLPDAGSGDTEYFKRLDELGTECMVWDHHAFDSYPTHCICVNNQLSEHYPNKSLCGAGVVYKFCQVLDKILCPQNPRSSYYLDLVAMAEIADCMSPADPETRYYISKGLTQINNGFFKQLIEQQSYSLFKTSNTLNYIKIAFYIAPLINAMVRVGTMEEKRQMFQAFIEPDTMIQSTKRGAKAGDMVRICEEVARKATNAKARQNRIKDKATELLEGRIQKEGLLDNKILVIEVYDEDDIPQELRGLIAAQFVNKYHRPTMIGKTNEEGFFRGSIRGNDSFEEVPDFKKFLENSGCMEGVYGHKNAAGYSIPYNKISNLISYANTTISDQGLENVYDVDYIFNANENFTQLGFELAAAEDFWGNEIKEPTVVIEDIPMSSVALMGENKDTTKIINGSVSYLRFKDADFAQLASQVSSGSTITVYGRFNINVWAGKKSLQVFIDDYEIKDSKFDF